MEGFIINEKGELDFKGEIFRVMPEYYLLPKESKLELLIMLVNWANDEYYNQTYNQNK
jgi:hypothetical protein